MISWYWGQCNAVLEKTCDTSTRDDQSQTRSAEWLLLLKQKTRFFLPQRIANGVIVHEIPSYPLDAPVCPDASPPLSCFQSYNPIYYSHYTILFSHSMAFCSPSHYVIRIAKWMKRLKWIKKWWTQSAVSWFKRVDYLLVACRVIFHLFAFLETSRYCQLQLAATASLILLETFHWFITASADSSAVTCGQYDNLK